MDTLNEKLERYRSIIESVLTEAARQLATDKIRDRTLFDRQADNYLIVSEGWRKDERIHSIVIHLEIIGGKVWLQADNTDLAIAEDLERAGIPKSDIVLGFQPAEVRPHTEYAVA